MIILVFSSGNEVWLSWKLSAEERFPDPRHNNKVSGAYVTGGARIHLYVFLDRLQENAIYCNKDSVIFIQTSAEPCSIAKGDNFETCIPN